MMRTGEPRTSGAVGPKSPAQSRTSGNSASGTPVQLYSCNGTAAQNWTIEADGTIRINGSCMDITGAGTANGTLVELWTCNGGANQQWQLIPVGQ